MEVPPRQPQHSILQLILLLLQHHRLVLGLLPHLGMLQVFFLPQRPALAHYLHQHLQLLDYLVHFIVIVLLHILPVSLLVPHKIVQFEGFSRFGDHVGLNRLHLIEGFIDIHVGDEEGRSGEDEAGGQVLSCPVEHLETNVTLPKIEDLTDEVVLEELHASQDVEHGRLLHPLTQGEELGRHGIVLGVLLALLGTYMDYSLRGYGEILVIQVLLVPDCHEVEGTELVRGNGLPVTVEELDGRVAAVLGKEGNSLLSCLDLYEQLVDVGANADEVGLAGLLGLVLLLVLVVLYYLAELLEIDGLVHVVTFFLFL